MEVILNNCTECAYLKRIKTLSMTNPNPVEDWYCTQGVGTNIARGVPMNYYDVTIPIPEWCPIRKGVRK